MLKPVLFFLSLYCISTGICQEKLTAYKSCKSEGNSIILITETDQKLRITSYGEFMVRIQPVRKGEDFFPDDYYEMVEPKKWNGKLNFKETNENLFIETDSPDGILLKIKKNPVRIEFYFKKDKALLLSDKNGIVWENENIYASFNFDGRENFTGLGHSYFGRSKKINLKGELIGRNYGAEHGEQAPLIVPFYLSSKGYGIFFNTTFHNFFNFGNTEKYEFGLNDHGFKSRMDYFFILGPGFPEILDRYTQLTGRPRLPVKAVFGLALSDKANPLGSKDPSGENWWKEKVTNHRKAGFPIDHLVNDNVWRAGGGERCNSFFEWDSTRYPDPAEYKNWLSDNGLITTIDFNRCIASKSEGWQPGFNIPDNSGIEFKESAPDLTRKEVRQWWWNLFWEKSLNPALNFPGDALWIDEFDEMGEANDSMILGNGRTWAEMKNYWFFLAAKALVQEGWDKSSINKRPFVWVRGMTAGAQRYATLWSGDILSTYEDMHDQVISMQLAGLSGFPYWGHDAGGFRSDDGEGPDATMYRQWSMAFGSFTPYWRPHGTGKSRWPLDRTQKEQNDAKVYSAVRYELLPYIYTAAYEAYEKGLPMARAMVLYYQNNSSAWKYDTQYFWGDEILAAPNIADSGNVSVWLPEGGYYDFWNDKRYDGKKVIEYPESAGRLPLFVKEGSIIPMNDFALSTAFIDLKKLNIHVYTGGNGEFNLYEDDGETELYKTGNQKRFIKFAYFDSTETLTIDKAAGTYRDAPADRRYHIIFHGINKKLSAEVNGKEVKVFDSSEQAEAESGAYRNLKEATLIVSIHSNVDRTVEIKLKADESAGE